MEPDDGESFESVAKTLFPIGTVGPCGTHYLEVFLEHTRISSVLTNSSVRLRGPERLLNACKPLTW